MKKILLFTGLFCSIAFVSYAQLTPSCPCTVNAAVFNLITPATSTNPAYYMAQPGPKFHLGRYFDNADGQNKWRIVYESPGGFVAQYYTSSPSSSLQPPCNDFWEVTGSTPKTYIPINFTGNTCTTLPISTVGSASVTTTINGIIYPVFTTNQIQTIPNPVVGQTVFDLSKGYLRTWNGTIWSPQ